MSAQALSSRPRTIIRRQEVVPTPVQAEVPAKLPEPSVFNRARMERRALRRGAFTMAKDGTVQFL